MAYIRYPRFMPSTGKSINVYNWKTLERNTDGVLVTIDFQVYQIIECDIIEIHEANLKPKKYKLEKKFRYLHNELSCSVCGGRGVLDWIHHITKPPVSSFGPDPYIRNPKGKTYFITTKKRKFFLSSTPIPKGFEECRKCFGSGVENIRNGMVSKDEVEMGMPKPDKQ